MGFSYKIKCGRCMKYKDKKEFFPGSYAVSYCKECIVASKRKQEAENPTPPKTKEEEEEFID